MLKYIKVKNFLSFKEETEINFESNFYGNKKDNSFKIWKNNDVLMKNMLIYWANASWKSNILETIDFIRDFVLYSHEKNFLEYSAFWNFLLDNLCLNIPSFFEIWFFIEDIEFKYNFEIFENKIITENLYKILIINKESREEIIFERDWEKIISWKNFKKELKKWGDKIREDSGVLSVLAQWNWKLEWKNIDYFFKKITIISTNDFWLKMTWQFIRKNIKYKKFFIKFLEFSDINICDIEIWKDKISKDFLDKIRKDFPDEEKRKEFIDYLSTKIHFWHKIKNSDEIKYFDLKNESDWTQKLFSILWPIIETIFTEWILFIDEIENKLHLHILQEIIRFINSDIQWKKYQFFFTTHNVWLMDLNVLKKEQIWIIEKNKDWESEFYTLFDFDKVREWMNLKKYFNAGVYGWVPNIWDFKSLLNNFELWEQ